MAETKNVINLANPAPLGLLGFGMTTILLNLSNAGVFSMGAMILAMGFFYGGIAQVIAGFKEWKKNNTFGFTAFTSYGLFWLSLVALLVLPKLGWAEASSPTAMGWYLTAWGVFTLCMFAATLRGARSIQFVFGSLALLFFLLAASDFTGSVALKQIAGVEGIICGASAFYAAIGQVLNEAYGRKILPL
jgi:succinate-acetate transporter protein